MGVESTLEAMRAMAREESCEGGPPFLTLSEEQLLGLSVESGLSLRELQLLALGHGMTPARYLRNYRGISPVDQQRLLMASVGLAGLGGLGGHLLETLVRLGVGKIMAADGDRFDECNLNRQLLSSLETMGMAKTEAARRRAAAINPAVELETAALMLDRKGFCTFLGGVDLIFDGLGGVAVKKMLLDCGREMGVPVVTAAIAGWSVIVTTVLPGRPAPPDLFGRSGGAEQSLGCLAPAIALAAAVQCGEGVLILCGREATLAGKLLAVDLSQGSFELYEL
jgi:molybdopterin-synthase adenylyltransferase